MMTLPDYSHFFCSSTCLPFRRSCYMYETCKNTQIELQHFCSPKKVVPTVFARYNREQLGKYTGKLIVDYWSWDKSMVCYGMVVYQKRWQKPVKGQHFQHYKYITRLFPYYFPIISLVVPYYFPIFPLLFPIVSIIYLYIISLLVPYFCPIISLYIIALFYPIIVPYASQVSKTINLDT